LEVRSARSALPTANTWAWPGSEFREAVLLAALAALGAGDEDAEEILRRLLRRAGPTLGREIS
jgi:hypothetical protein